MSEQVEVIIGLLEGLRADVNDPYIAHKKAGDMIELINKINTKIDNYDRANRKRRNRRI